VGLRQEAGEDEDEDELGPDLDWRVGLDEGDEGDVSDRGDACGAGADDGPDAAPPAPAGGGGGGGEGAACGADLSRSGPGSGPERSPGRRLVRRAAGLRGHGERERERAEEAEYAEREHGY
jgi:hypothetical protein